MTDQGLSEDKLTVSQRRWLEHIRQQQRSGLSVAGYVQQQGLAISTFYAMRQRLSIFISGETSVQHALFQAVTVEDEQPSLPGSGLTLAFDLPGKLRCEVRGDVATVAALLQLLSRQPA